jgi:hypothetical protein
MTSKLRKSPEIDDLSKHREEKGGTPSVLNNLSASKMDNVAIMAGHEPADPRDLIISPDRARFREPITSTELCKRLAEQ